MSFVGKIKQHFSHVKMFLSLKRKLKELEEKQILDENVSFFEKIIILEHYSIISHTSFWFKQYKNELKLNEDLLNKHLQELEEVKKANQQLKEDLELKEEKLASQSNEISDINQEKAQLAQNVSDLEEKKVELQARLIREPTENTVENVNQTEVEQTEFTNFIKVSYRRDIQNLIFIN